ncbi:ACP S-malonyltransferase [Isoptericola sp. b441]|uniref:[acyl-carrier-protein] S-malonyltransferase n=1 Tax=Actinotalea lenta TaxID=3064654 RepID=A0ABT9DB25_9CELL|nr:ACP S-malonyltransferase [Isoptericola sp. b441]MDO8108061.1 ACP S-malonyltransferase [Isoptericola sp. b441]
MLAIVCPGQGSQTPGFLAPWLELPSLAERLGELSRAAGVDLLAHGTTSDADTIRDTAVAQPLIVSASLLTLEAVLDGRPATELVGVTAGHSVGELAAAVVAGVLDGPRAVTLVGARARAMADAAARVPTGMSAVVGGDMSDVLAAIESAGAHPANVNGGGQVVAAGTLEALASLADTPPARARVIPLQVAGAFHTPFMEPALEPFGAAAAATDAAEPALPWLSDLDGRAMPADGRAALDRLVQQVVAPVRWDLVCEGLVELGVTGLVELAPAGVLTGLARRTLPGVETVAVKTPDDLLAAHDLITRHAHKEIA